MYIVFVAEIVILEKKKQEKKCYLQLIHLQVLFSAVYDLFLGTLHANNLVWSRNILEKIPWYNKILGIFPKLIPRTFRLQ
jgi:hypothetical protein